jgi:hypothetical protein
MIGLSHTDADENFSSIDFALACSTYGTIGVYETGVKIFQHGDYTPGDRLAVMVQGETVSFHHNDRVFFTSLKQPAFPLVVDTSFFHPGAKAEDIKLQVADMSRPTSMSNLKMNNQSQRQFRRLSIKSTDHEIAYKELAQATNGFTTQNLGEGGFATVHLAVLNGRTVAVKKDKELGRLNAAGGKFLDEQFLTEVLVLYGCNHPNICQLLHHSIDGPARCLVYEFCANGCISDRLRLSTANKPTFTWAQRLKIAVESARGLTCLHTQAKPVVHRDIKGSNVLVTDTFEAKLCDFGTVRKMTQQRMSLSTRGSDDADDGTGDHTDEDDDEDAPDGPRLRRKSSQVVSSMVAEVGDECLNRNHHYCPS